MHIITIIILVLTAPSLIRWFLAIPHPDGSCDNR